MFDSVFVNTRFVFYQQSTIHAPSKSKAGMVLEYLKEHADKAFFSKEIADSLKDSGVRISDVMSNARRYERQGLVYVRGYRTHDRQTRFKEGYLLTWINTSLPRENAISEAVERTDRALEGRAATSPTIERVYRIRDMIFAATKTYVLECKWGLVRKRDVDDFLNVLRWSKDFGVDTAEGRQLKQGVTGVFAGTAFKPDENVLVSGQPISLATYANRLNISLLKAADFNEKLHDRGCKRDLSIQKICSAARDENEVRELLENIWREPAQAGSILGEVLRKNEEVYRFEKVLSQPSAVTS